MKRSHSLSLSVSMLLSMAAASAAHGASLSTQYTLLSTPTATATSPYTTSMILPVGSLKVTNWDVYATNPSGEALISETGPTGTGTELFLFDPAHASNGLVAIGPTSITNVNGTGKYSQAGGLLSDMGAAAGYSTDSHNSLNGWVYIPGTGTKVLAQTGDLTGATYNSGTTFAQYSVAVAGAGFVAGAATRYSGISTIGTDLWFYNPNNASAGAKIIPLINSTVSPASNYKDNVTVSSSTVNYQSGTIYGIDDAGLVLGASSRYMSQTSPSASPQRTYGSDAWVYNGAASSLATAATQIGLLQDPSTTGSNYSLQTTYSVTFTDVVRNTTLATISTAGTIGGSTTVYNSSPTVYNTSIGSITWVYTPGSTPSAVNFSYTTANNNSFTATGSVSDGSGGNYARVGLYTDAAHYNTVGLDNSIIYAINANGKATGTSAIYNSNHAAISSANDAWYYSGVAGSSSVLIDPITSSTNFSLQYNYSSGGGSITGTARSAVITGFNANGWVAGYSTRYALSGGAVYTGSSPSSIGQDAWVYDATNNTVYVVDAPLSDVNSYFSSTIQYLSNDGIALGYYKTASAGATSLFAWYNDGTANGKFYTISSTGWLSNSLSSANWSSLASLISIDSNGDLYGLGVTSAANTFPSGNALFELQPTVPEPATLGLLSLAAVGLLARRRTA